MPILSAFVAAALVAGSPDAREWASGLASSDPNVRFSTIDAIEAQGLKALPTLRAIAADPSTEARSRAASLIEAIGSRRLLRPTPVTLDLRDRPGLEAVEALGSASGFRIDVEPGRASRPISFRTEQPAGFFETLDRLGGPCGLRLDLYPSYSGKPAPGVRVRLVGQEGPPAPASYAGPYRVSVNRLERHRSVVQGRDPADSAVREDFAVVLDVAAEPGIVLDRNGPLRLSEAADDRRADLRGTAAGDPGLASGQRAWTQDGLGTFSYRLPLRLPAERGKAIARLRGFLPIVALARTDELFSATLAGVEGKELTGGGVAMRITRASISGSSGFLELTVRGERPPDFGAFAAGPRQMTLATLRLGYNLDDHLRIEDADGIPYTTNSNGTAPPSPDGTMTFRVNVFPTRPCGPPARVRYFGLAGVATEVPFDFKDLPIP